MNKHLHTELATILLALAVALPVGAAEEAPAAVATMQSPSGNVALPAPPTRLSGRWYTPDKRYSQVLRMEEIDVVARTARLVYYSTHFGCTIEGSPMTISRWNGQTLEAKLNEDTWCFKELKVELTRDGTAAFVGKITFIPIISGGGYAPILTVRVSQQ